MNPIYKTKVWNSLKEYKNNFNNSLKQYLELHEDFDEIYFFENEREFYAKLHFDCYSISDSFNSPKNFQIHTDNLQKLAPEIYDKLFDSKIPNGWNFDLNEKYKATFKSIINFLDDKIRQYSDAKNSMGVLNYPPIPAIVDEKPEKSVNPYPRIFKNYDAFLFFEKLRDEFGNTNLNLSNYSFVYHRMLKDDLIFTSILKLEYYDFLANYDIHISRIKSFKEIGKKQLRESVYSSAK